MVGDEEIQRRRGRRGRGDADDGDSIMESYDENSNVDMEDPENFQGTSTNRRERREGRRK